MRPRLLLDSELLLWALAAPTRLSRPLRRLLDESEVYASAASVLEIGLAAAGQRLAADVAAALEPSGFRVLTVSAEHAAVAATLQGRFGDPVDRVLVAQASVDDLLFVTNDTALAAVARRSRPPRNRLTGRRPRQWAGAGRPTQSAAPRILLASEIATRHRRRN